MALNDILLIVALVAGAAGAGWFLWWYVHEKIREEVPPEGRKWV